MKSRGLFLEEFLSYLDRFSALLVGYPVTNTISGSRSNDKIEPIARGVRVWRSDDLHDIAILNLTTKRRHSAVDSGPGARIPHFRVNQVSKVDGRCASRQLNHLPHGSEGIDILRIEIEL